MSSLGKGKISHRHKGPLLLDPKLDPKYKQVAHGDVIGDLNVNPKEQAQKG